MKIKPIIFVALGLAVITFIDFSLAGEATSSQNPVDGQAKDAPVRPAPFENYWAARSWDLDGARFWHAKETPTATTPTGNDLAATATTSTKKK